MRTKTPAAGFKPVLALILALTGPGLAHAAPVFLKGPDGNFRPFKLHALPLAQFVRAYAQATGTRIEVAGKWDEEIKGAATLYVHSPLAPATFTELFHQVLYSNGYATVDLPGGTGWIVERGRDARDGPIKTYDSTDFPPTYRLVTVSHALKHIDAEHAARIMRSFMPASSRIIPSVGSRVTITDTGRNIKKLVAVMDVLDTEEAAKKLREAADQDQSGRACAPKEQRIESLVVEKLEIKDGSPGFTIPGAPAPTGGRK